MLRHGNSQSLFDNGFYTQNSYVVAIVVQLLATRRNFASSTWVLGGTTLRSTSFPAVQIATVRLTMVTSTGDRKDGLECNMGALIITHAFWGYNGPPNPILI